MASLALQQIMASIVTESSETLRHHYEPLLAVLMLHNQQLSREEEAGLLCSQNGVFQQQRSL